MAKNVNLDDILKEYEAKKAWEKPSQAPNAPKNEEKPANRSLPDLKDVDQGAILAVLNAIATFDPGTIFNENHTIKELSEMPLETRVCIKSLKVRELYEDKIKVGEIKDIQFWDKMSASEMLGKYKKMFNDQPPPQVNNILIVESLKSGLARLQEYGPSVVPSTLDATSGGALNSSDGSESFTTSSDSNKEAIDALPIGLKDY